MKIMKRISATGLLWATKNYQRKMGKVIDFKKTIKGL